MTPNSCSNASVNCKFGTVPNGAEWRTGKYKVVLVISIALIVLLVSYSSFVLANKIPMDPASNLQQLGYPTDTIEQILVAVKSENFFVRHQALEVLVKRTAKEAIPTLRLFLKDPHIRVRSMAAHLLGTLADKSGLEQMRKDFKDLVPSNGDLLPSDPNEIHAAIAKKKAENYYLWEALIIARVLAELGDRQGYELAARMALEGPLAAQRTEAVFGLVEMAKTDPNILSREGIDPVSVLCKMAESEKEQVPFGVLINLVYEKLNPDIGVKVLEKAKDSLNQSDEHRRVARIVLNKVKAKKKASETMGKAPS